MLIIGYNMEKISLTFKCICLGRKGIKRLLVKDFSYDNAYGA
jgi:hypothetical protein